MSKRKKYPGVYRDANGKIYYQVELGFSAENGRERKKGRTDKNGKPFSTEKEAYQEVIRLKEEYRNTKKLKGPDMTYRRFMEEWYIPHYRTSVENTTFKSRQIIFDKLISKFGTLKLNAITIEHVNAFRTRLLTSKEEGGFGYKQSYSSLVFGTLRQSLDYAVELEYLNENISKRAKAISKGKFSTNYWTKEDLEKVLSYTSTDSVYSHFVFILIWLYFMTGVRLNEGCALFWNDIDFSKKIMRIHHNLVIENKETWERKKYTKTTSGNRVITLDNDTIEYLMLWRDRQKDIGLGKEDDFVLSYDGKPMVKSTITKIIKRYAKLAEVPIISQKGLRHSHVSYLINEFDVSVLLVSQRLGHSSPEITLKHYSHLWRGADAIIAEKMTGNINVSFSKENMVSFTGNQFVNPRLCESHQNPTKTL